MPRGSADDHQRCPRCGSPLDPRGACPACLLSAALASPETPDLAGEQIGRYAIKHLLGQGGMGIVYEAFDTQLERTVALKILADGIDNPEQLVREAQLGAALPHEHIVPVYEVGEHEGIAYFTMMRVDGGPLTTPASDARRATEIALAIAKAMGFAHRHGILHRDLKPANVLVDREGRAFVTDFGIAAREGFATGAAPASGGTPQYMAPEVWRREPGSASTAADVWGAGAILYELLRGHPPFTATTWDELQRQVTTEAPPPLAGVHLDLAAVCLCCLQKDPARRYKSADDLAVDLAHVLAGEPVNARPLGVGARWIRRAVRHPVITALSALLAVAAVLAVVSAVSLSRAREAAFHGADVTARSLARLTALQFDRYTAVLEAVGKEPRLALALADPASSRGADECARLLAEVRGPAGVPFSTWFLLDETGKMIGRAPVPIPDTRGRSYQFRDYFLGVQEHERAHLPTAYVSRAYQSEGDRDFVIAVAVAVHDSAGRWVGLLAASLPTGAAFGSIELDDPGDADFTAALLAPRSRERGQSVASPDLVFLQHRALAPGEALSAGTRDVLGAELGQSGLVRLVPVRGTPFSVLVHVAYDGPLAEASPSLQR